MADRPFQRLDAASVEHTVARLGQRIQARFPGRGLARLAGELELLTVEVRDSAADTRARVRRTRLLARLLILVIVAATLVAFALAIRDATTDGPHHSFEWLPLIESSINDLVFAAIAIFFLLGLPNRIERGHTLTLLHRLRSMAHIIDMHQLTKDPERARSSYIVTTSSPTVGLDSRQMEHYLDYCSEMLSLVGKVAALCAEESQDSVVLDTVSTIETLTSGMARKIWQKISLLPD